MFKKCNQATVIKLSWNAIKSQIGYHIPKYVTLQLPLLKNQTVVDVTLLLLAQSLETLHMAVYTEF